MPPNYSFNLSEFDQLVEQGKTAAEISSLLGISRWSVYDRCRTQGLTVASPIATYTDRLTQLVHQGKTANDIARELGLGVTTVRDACRRHNLPLTKRSHIRIEQIIPETDVDKVRDMVNSGLLQREIADIYSTGQSVICRFMIRHEIAANNGRNRKRDAR